MQAICIYASSLSVAKDGLIQVAQPNELSKSVQHNQPQGLTQNDPVVTSSNTECQQRYT